MIYATLLFSVGKMFGINPNARVHSVIKPQHISGFPSYLSGAGSLGSGRSPRNGGVDLSARTGGVVKIEEA